MVCAFFGHKSTPDEIKPALEQAVKRVLEKKPDATFYVGNQGAFDGMAKRVLKKYSALYPQMSYAVVLAYLPNDLPDKILGEGIPTMFPEGIENSPPKFAISYRNKWIANKADMVICYITHDWGGAAQFVDIIRRRGKEVINLAENRKEL